MLHDERLAESKASNPLTLLKIKLSLALDAFLAQRVERAKTTTGRKETFNEYQL
jgi:hypothetical protein